MNQGVVVGGGGGGTQHPVSPGRQMWSQTICAFRFSIGGVVVVGSGIQQPVSPGRQKCWQALSSRVTGLIVEYVGVGEGVGVRVVVEMQQPVSPGRQK